jgi:cyclopropane fatty-acyl-phospholipid synthase-like methyltransferase
LSLAPFVPSPLKVVDKMLELAEVKPGEIVYDLGCGDGRIVMAAAQKFGAKAVGIELDEGRYQSCVRRVKEAGLDDMVKIIHSDIAQMSVRDADVVTLYLLESANQRLRPILERDLRPGARVVSHDFPMLAWKTARTEKVREGSSWFGTHTIYLYKR